MAKELANSLSAFCGNANAKTMLKRIQNLEEGHVLGGKGLRTEENESVSPRTHSNYWMKTIMTVPWRKGECGISWSKE